MKRTERKQYNPLISIIIPVYNGSNYLKEAIDSALAQDYQHKEIIVINDGSTDNGKTDRVAKAYGKQIRYFHQNNGGVASALNFGIEHMKGEWFSWLSHDDVYKANKLSTMVAYLHQHPAAKILYSDYEVVDKALKHLHNVSVKPGRINNMQVRLINSYPLNGCTMLIRHDCFTKVGKFNPQLRSTQDYDLWFKLAGVYQFDYVPFISLLSRLHADQGSHTYAKPEEADQLYLGFINQISPSLIKEEFSSQADAWLLKVAIRYKWLNYDQAALAAIQKSKQLNTNLSFSLILTQTFCRLPSSLISQINIYKNKVEVPIYKLISIIRSVIRKSS